MEVKPGYKQTEAGVIPDEWNASPLKGRIGIAHGFPFASEHFAGQGSHRLTTPGHFYEAGGFRDIGEKQKYYDGPVPADYVLQPGDLIVAMTEQADGLLGSAAVIPKEHGYLHNQRLGRVKSLSSEIELGFLFYVFNSPSYRAKVRETAAGTKVKHTSPGKLLEICVQLPPPSEQRAIAVGLSDVDALLGALDQLIAKKRDLKLAAMQQLLTGQTRLPGFHGEWEVKTVAEIATVSKGTQLHSSETNPDGHFPHFNGGISASSYTDKSNTPANTIAISEGGNSCGYVQFMSQSFWCGGHCYAVVPKEIENHFLYHALKGEQTAIMGLRVGSGLPNIQKTALAAFKLNVPSERVEQNAIAEVLTDMDAELAALEQRRAKTRALKQGMMQELLTGRTRLV
ncbi:MAG TPA: restriction endonuclease subunit S [Candidatus Saccharimonadales bacterium]|nr:restriction endonuclease subunit S [Candidatus Saccharimonadales bacterium]